VYSRKEASDYKNAQKNDIVKRGDAIVVKIAGDKNGNSKTARFEDAVYLMLLQVLQLSCYWYTFWTKCR